MFYTLNLNETETWLQMFFPPSVYDPLNLHVGQANTNTNKQNIENIDNNYNLIII
jgi:hypothetical protein